MSKRLQVLVPEAEMAAIQLLARRQRIPVGEWVRRALRRACAGEPAIEPEAKLRAIRKAAAHAFPTAGIEQMLEETERGYLA
ncbi:MAG: ribbon-helix-helix protein, CopG family [Terriglobales bacterium]